MRNNPSAFTQLLTMDLFCSVSIQEETPLFLAAREGSCEAVKVLLAHFANREITDHMDRLPRDIAQDRMHHDIVQLLDEYNTVRSPQSHASAGHHLAGHALSPLMCPPGSFLPNMKNTPQSKKNRRAGTKGIGQHGSSLKDAAKARSKKLTLDMQSALLDSSVTLSPVDSLDSPRGGASNAGYITNPASPAAMPSPGIFHSVPTTPMVHANMMDTGGPFAVSLAGLNELNQASHSYTLNPAQMGLSMGMISPVSVPFDWHSRAAQAAQCSQPMVSMVHPGTPGALLMHPQQVFRSQQPMLQPTPVSSTPTISPIKLPSIAEQQQQLHGHAMTSQQALASLGSSTPPTAQPAQVFYQQQPPQVPAVSQSQSVPPQVSQAAPVQASSSSVTTAGLDDYPTPPSQHSCTSNIDATPKHYLHVQSEHPYLTPSPESPEAWSSPSPHCVSDWSDSTPSPTVSGSTPAHTQIPHASEANGKMQVFA